MNCQPGRTGRICSEYDITENKTAQQSDHFTEANAMLTIDGNYSTCSYTSVQAQPWWEVNFGQQFIVEGLVITGHKDHLGNMGNMVIEVYNGGSPQMCKAMASPPVFVQTTVPCARKITGDKLRISLHHDENSTVQLWLCDVGVYGECVDGKYGHYCENQCGDCKNRTACNKDTGHCAACDVGFKFPLCQEDCDFGYYGDHCTERCGHCKNNGTCEVDTGECLYGCEPGYYEPNCTIACKSGTFGDHCEDCGHCWNNAQCNTTNGHCPKRKLCNAFDCPGVNCSCAPGTNCTRSLYYCPNTPLCEVGWYKEDCRSECPDGKFGETCVYDCGHCFNNSCNNTNGICEQGCLPGYKPSDVMCKTICDPGRYGENCGQPCGNCRNNTDCQPEDGLCKEGCEVGYQGSICKDTCDDGLWGLNCDSECGHCSDIKCDAHSGHCSGTCSPGWLGVGCTEACQHGKYGQDCLLSCPSNCMSPQCNNEDGSCACKRGWTGPLCKDVCNYGLGCPEYCGKCRGGDVCDRVTGACPSGCSAGWEGELCTTEVIIKKPVDKQFVAGMIVLGVVLFLMAVAIVIWIVYRKMTGQKLEPDWMGKARSSIRRSFRRSISRLSFRNRYHEHMETNGGQREEEGGFGGHPPHGKRHGKGLYRRLYECVGISSNTLQQDDFPRIYLQLQEKDPDGKTKFETSYQSFLRQRPAYNPINQNGRNMNGVNSYYNQAVHTDEIQLDMPSSQPRVPAFLPLGSNLSGFFLIHAGAQSESVWNHLQQRQVETVVSIEKEASVQFKAGERYEIGSFTIECLEVHRNPCYIESKITIRKRGTQGRRAIRHIETSLWENDKDFAAIPTFLLFIQRIQQLYQNKRERPVLINYKNIHDQAVLYCVCASLIELTRETGRIDVLRAVNSGGTLVGKVFTSFEHFKYLHDVMFHTIAMDSRNQKF